MQLLRLLGGTNETILDVLWGGMLIQGNLLWYLGVGNGGHSCRYHVGCMPRGNVGLEEIVKLRHVVGSDWLEYIYNVEYN